MCGNVDLLLGMAGALWWPKRVRGTHGDQVLALASTLVLEEVWMTMRCQVARLTRLES